MGWSAFGKHSNMKNSNLPLSLKWGTNHLPLLPYVSETWCLTKAREKLRIVKRGMDTKVLGKTWRNGKWASWIRNRYRLKISYRQSGIRSGLGHAMLCIKLTTEEQLRRENLEIVEVIALKEPAGGKMKWENLLKQNMKYTESKRMEYTNSRQRRKMLGRPLYCTRLLMADDDDGGVNVSMLSVLTLRLH